MNYKTFTMPMLLTFAGGMLSLLLLLGIGGLALKYGVPNGGLTVLMLLITACSGASSSMFTCFFTLIQVETGIKMPAVPTGSTATETTQVTQKVETPAAPAVDAKVAA